MKTIQNGSKRKNPLLEQKKQEGIKLGFEMGKQEGLREGWETGFSEARDTSVAHMATRLERIGKVKGIGPKLIERIMEEIAKPLTDDELAFATEAMAEMRQRQEEERKNGSKL